MEVYLLPEDRVAAEERIAELEQKTQDLGEDFRDAFTQSSETWHDNSPFEAVRDTQAMYAAELHKLRSLIRSSTLVAPKKKRGTIGVGDTVRLSNGRQYKLAGNWTHKAGKHSDGVYWVSSGTPVAQNVLGRKVGDEVTFGTVSASITEVNP